MGENGLTVADALALQDKNSNNDNNNMMGAGGAWWVIILILFFAFAGWGQNRNGSDGTNTVVIPSGGFGGDRGSAVATQQTVTDAFNFNNLDNGIRGAQNGLCQGFYAVSNELGNLGSQMQAGFYNNEVSALQGNYALQSAINQTNYDTQSTLNNGFNNVQSAIAQTNYNMKDCCCETRESIMQANFNNQTAFNNIQSQVQQGFCGVTNGQEKLNYAIAQAACDIKSNADSNTDRVLNYLTQSEITALRDQLQSANFQLSQLSQTSNIVNALQPTPKPAYVVSSPYTSVPFGGAFPFNNGNCNSCC